MTPSSSRSKPSYVRLEVGDERKMDLLFGEKDAYIAQICRQYDVDIAREGRNVVISGKKKNVDQVRVTLVQRLALLNEGTGVTTAAFNEVVQQEIEAEQNSIKTPNITVEARKPNQAKLIQIMRDNEISLGVGPAGTGKTYLAVAMAIRMLLDGKVDKLLFVRPALEAGEKLGYLPGDQKQKVDPYMRPIYDALYEMLGQDKAVELINDGKIEIGALGLMRGRTFKKTFVILDEAQNATVEQMKMFTTRFGEGSRMVLTGDPSQNDLPEDPKTGKQQLSGLTDFVTLLEEANDTVIARVFFTPEDVVRHPLVEHIVNLYADRDERLRKAEAALAMQEAVDKKNNGEGHVAPVAPSTGGPGPAP